MFNKLCISLPLARHPLLSASKAVKTEYISVLRAFVEKNAQGDEWAKAAVAEYSDRLGVEDVTPINDSDLVACIRRLTADRFSLKEFWFSSYRYCLISDILFLTAFNNASQVKANLDDIQLMLRKRHREGVSKFCNLLLHGGDIKRKNFKSSRHLIDCWHKNADFINLPEKRILVTATVSAGKSTLINALIGKPLTQTSQEVCTGNLCYLNNKPFEDGAIHLCASPIRFNASYNDLAKTERSETSHIASYFRALVPLRHRVSIIDTPGVNFALNRDHGKMARKTLADESYEKLIYVLNANKLGTDEEFRYLKYVSKNVPKEKLIFVLNKLDDFKKGEDSIAKSIDGVRNDLRGIGYENPVICPLSAYFALLIKMKQNSETLTEDEQDVYDFYVKKFSKLEYNLSYYYGEALVKKQKDSDDITAMSIRCGLYGLENMLFEGKSNEKSVH